MSHNKTDSLTKKAKSLRQTSNKSQFFHYTESADIGAM